jgi:hypothetical protein
VLRTIERSDNGKHFDETDRTIGPKPILSQLASSPVACGVGSATKESQDNKKTTKKPSVLCVNNEHEQPPKQNRRPHPKPPNS